MAGVFITRGMTVAIPAGGLKISLGHDPAASVTLHVHFDVCPTWCELAMAHLETAKSRQADRSVAWQATEETENVVNEKARTLEREFESSMQAIMAAAIAIDAFYAVLQPHVGLEPELIEKWREERTARYSQVTEVVRRAFRLKTNGTKTLRENLKQIYRFRDLAVHPSGKIQAPILHPELNVGVEWRFAYFCATNAENVVNATTAMLWDLANQGKPANDKIANCVKGLKARLDVLFPSGHPLVKRHGQLAKEPSGDA
jgi:hypothetical protein